MEEDEMMEEPRQTTQADIDAMTDMQLLGEAQMIRWAYETSLPHQLTRRQSLQLFWLTTAVSREMTKRGIKLPEK